MKHKVLYLSLLSTLVFATANVEATQRRRAEIKAAQEAPELQAEVQQGRVAGANLDLAGHGQDPVASMQDLHDRIGAHSAPTGATTNHRLTDLHNTLGHEPAGGAANDSANKKAEDAAAQLGASAAPTGPTIHHKITDAQTVLGVRTLAPGATGPTVHDKLTDALAIAGESRATATSRGARGAVIPTLIGREEAILARLKAGIATLHPNGGQYEVRTVARTKSPAGTARANPPVANDIAAAGAATNIHDCLAALGW